MNDGSGLQYLLTDHLGSTVAVTNSSGTLTSQQRYLPFGGARTISNSPIAGTDFTYTGQRKLDDGMGGIMDYKARFYSPALGRFIQPDSIIPSAANPQSWNRFSYVHNSPINFNDPTGHIAGCDTNYLGSCKDLAASLKYSSRSNGSGKSKDKGNGNDGGDKDGEEHCVPPPGQWLCDLGALTALADDSSHHYVVTKVVCPAEWHCTQAQMIYYLSLFAYPGQDPLNGPALPNKNYSVSPFGWFPEGSPPHNLGLIQVVVSNGGLTSTNITQPSHIFCCGKVDRTLTQDASGAWSVTSVGDGSNSNAFIADVNQGLGPEIFQDLDTSMLIYIMDQKFPDSAPSPPL